jgi:hypothetical protein
MKKNSNFCEVRLKTTISIVALLFSSWVLAQEPKQCVSHPKDQALSQQMKTWQKSAESMQDEVRHFTQELTAAYSQPTLDAQTEEKFRARWDEMDHRHRAIYSEANRLSYEAADRLRNSKDCENTLSGEAEKLRLMQSSLYNNLLEADPTLRAAAHALKARST